MNNPHISPNAIRNAQLSKELFDTRVRALADREARKAQQPFPSLLESAEQARRIERARRDADPGL